MNSDFESPQIAIDRAERLFARLKALGVLGGVGGIALIGFMFFRLGGSISDDINKWGLFGDFVGGVLNPFYALLALITLLGTFALQIRELQLSASELRKSAESLAQQNSAVRQQTFESTLFQLIRLHLDTVEAMHSPESPTIDGRVRSATRAQGYLKRVLHDLKEVIKQEGKSAPLDYYRALYDGIFYNIREAELGHYFRQIYYILKFIDVSHGIDKRFYASLVRAQLSSVELQLLFYNCLSTRGTEKLKPLVERFAMFKSLPLHDLPGRRFGSLFDVGAFGGANLDFTEP